MDRGADRRFDDAIFPKRLLSSRRAGLYLRVIEGGEVAADEEVVRLRSSDPFKDLHAP